MKTIQLTPEDIVELAAMRAALERQEFNRRDDCRNDDSDRDRQHMIETLHRILKQL